MLSEAMLISHDHRVAVFRFLDQLHRDDRASIFGAAPIVQEKFGVSAGEARALHVDWMKSFSFDRSPEERAAVVAPGDAPVPNGGEAEDPDR